MRDPFGVHAWRQKPLRDRMLPSFVYALMAVLSGVLAVYLFAGPDDLDPTRARNVGLLFVLLGATSCWLAVLARRVRE